MTETYDQVGYLVTNMKSAREAEIGDTLHAQNKPVKPLIDIEPAKVDIIQNLRQKDTRFSIHGYVWLTWKFI